MKTEKQTGLSGNALKIIAIIAMTIDHLAWMNITEYSQAETPIQIFLHVIGRLTAPIMFFFVAEGYNGRRGKIKWLGTFFYIYYPVHLVLIGILQRII